MNLATGKSKTLKIRFYRVQFGGGLDKRVISSIYFDFPNKSERTPFLPRNSTNSGFGLS